MADEPQAALPPDKDLKWLSSELASEQEYYWVRFSSFATLQAGLLVLITSDTVKHVRLLSLVAASLAVVWCYVQYASVYYVNRLKPLFRDACKASGFDYPRHPVFGRKGLSPTDVSAAVPAFLALFWLVFPIWWTR